MNQSIIIGHRIVNGKPGDPVTFDVLKLILTRLLICANSGGGKSWILRRLAELLFPIMPVIIFDWEGEFATLREKFDFVLVGKGGETPADCRSARLVILKLLELRASAVIDLSELSIADKHRYVRLACEAAINAPKNLWQPTAFIFDEVHEVCPENGKGHSEAKQAVLGFPTKGRKRRFLAIFATQRLHKLALDARAEMLNRLIGMTFEPDDLNGAASILGIGKKEMEKFKHEMRTMEPGSFFAFGRAISLETILLKVGPVQTSHESEHAKYGLNAPPPTAKIKALLPQLADLPKEAEKVLETEKELRAEVARLNHELSSKPKPVEPTPPKEVIKEVPVLTKDAIKLIARAVDAFDEVRQAIGDFNGQAQHLIDPLNKLVTITTNGMQAARSATKPSAMPVPLRRLSKPLPPNLGTRETRPSSAGSEDSRAPGEISGVGQRILDALAELELLGVARPAREIVALLANYTNLKSDGFVKAVSQLRTNGLVQYPDSDSIAFTETGRAAANYPSAPRSSEEIQQRVCNLIGGKASQILRPLIEFYPDAVPREQIAAAAGYGNLKSDGFVKAVSRLRTLGFVDYPASQTMRATDILFLK